TQSLEGIINAKSLIIPSGSQITFTKKLTTGWEKVVNWTFDPDTMATASKKFGEQTYTIWKGKLYHSAGNNGSYMTKVDGAELIEIGEASDWFTDKRRSDGLALFPVSGKNVLHSNGVKHGKINGWDTASTSYMSDVNNNELSTMILTDGAYWYSPYTIHQLLASNPHYQDNYLYYDLTSDKTHYMMKDSNGNWKWYKCEESEFDSIATIAERVLETAEGYNI
ncbi:MAG: hypothetical protein Q4E61_00525, partial [Alphaproteobacteria bacterium]|nr:hypothetical protein [Alphaproteobacteria bacterium]